MNVERAAARKVGVWAATALVTGESISLGIFLTPAGMARSLGSPALLLAVWIAMALFTLAGALCFSELAVRFPQDGGEYIYLRRGFGRHAAFLYGWMAALVMYPGVAASLAVGVVPYLQVLFRFPKGMAMAVSAFLLAAAGAVSYLGLRFSNSVMAALNWIKIPLLLLLAGWAFFFGHASMANLEPLTTRRAGSDPLFGAVAGALIAAFYCFGGWWEAGKIAGQIRNPRRTLPIAFTAGVGLVSVIYLLISLAFVAVVPLSQVQSNTAFVAQFGFALFGLAGERVLSVLVVLCVAGGLIVVTMVVPRVTRALGQEEMAEHPVPAFAALARLHPRFQTPSNAVLLQTALAIAALVFGAFDRILAYIVFSAVVFLAATVATLFRAGAKGRTLIFPAIFVAGCVALAAMLLIHNPWPSLAGAAITLAGLPARRLLLRGRSSALPLSNPSFPEVN